MKLTDAACRNVKPQKTRKKLSDGGGLQLWVEPTGGKLWRLAYRFSGKQKVHALGPYPLVSLAEARQEREEAKKLLRQGFDPANVRKQTKRANAVNGDTFGEIADEYIGRLRLAGRADATLKKVEWLIAFTRPKLAEQPITTITSANILEVVRETESRGTHETAKRLKSTIGAVFRYAIATARCDANPTVSLAGALIQPKVRPRPAIIEPKALGALLRAIDGYEGSPATHAALRLLPILFPRPGELRLARWSEFDLQERVWSIPAERMKMRRTHNVPLPRQAIAILDRLRHITGNGVLAFPGVRTHDRPISENTLNAALRRLGYSKDEVTAHGFRATATTLLNESRKWHPDAIERQLAHVEKNDVRRAYLRGEHWDERVEMMSWWPDFLDELREGK